MLVMYSSQCVLPMPALSSRTLRRWFRMANFFSSFKDAFEVVRSLRSQGYRAEVKIVNPHYSI